MVADGERLDQVDIFLSYAWEDGRDHVKRLVQRLREESPRFSPWYDRMVPPQEDFDPAILRHLLTADVMIVVLTNCVADRPWCRREINLADRKGIDTIVVRMDEGAELPFAVSLKEPLDFVTDAEDSWARLVQALHDYAKPEHEASKLRRKVAGPSPAVPAGRLRIFLDDNRDSATEERLRSERESGPRPADPAGSVAATGPERPKEPLAGAASGMILINEVPETAQTQFRDRLDKLNAIDEALRRPGVRLVVLSGAGGIGKTALVGEVRRRLRQGELHTEMAGFIYLATGYQRISAGIVLECLGRLSPAAGAALAPKLASRLSWQAKLNVVLPAVAGIPAVLVIDDADALLGDDGEMLDRDLDGLLRELIRRDDHMIRLWLVTGAEGSARWPDEVNRTAVELCEVDDGLPETEIPLFLSTIDEPGILDLDEVPRSDLRRLTQVSGGSPRFLELAYCLLRADPRATLRSLLDDIAPDDEVRPDDARTALIQRIIGQLKRTERRAVQALAVFGRPVPAEAVDFLLRDFVVGVDSAPVLSRLHEWRLIRRDGDRYYLPPRMDVPEFRATVPAGTSTDWMRPEVPFTLSYLFQRAADYFIPKRPGAAVDMADIQPYFDEIDLRLAGTGYRRALVPMEEVEDRFLTRWGQSAALNHWRRQMRGRIGDDYLEAHNLTYLVAARDGDEDPFGLMATALTAAMEQPWAGERPADRARLRLLLARVYHDDGRLGRAAEEYRSAVRECADSDLPYEHATARMGLGRCLARLGVFDAAGREFEEARRIGETLDREQRLEILATTSLNHGWLLGQVEKECDKALASLDDGHRYAREMGDILLEGRILNGRAALLCELGQARRAVGLAEEAANMGVRTRNVTLSRDANVTLAVAYLHCEDVREAVDAATLAVGFPAGMRALGAWATRGVALYRAGDLHAARTAFHHACTESWLRLRREPGEYAAHDVAGLALSGLTLCEDERRLADAVEAYRSARAISLMPGSRRRSVARLRLFGGDAEANLSAALRAADGQDVSPPVRFRL